MHWDGNKLKKGERRSLGGSTSGSPAIVQGESHHHQQQPSDPGYNSNLNHPTVVTSPQNLSSSFPAQNVLSSTNNQTTSPSSPRSRAGGLFHRSHAGNRGTGSDGAQSAMYPSSQGGGNEAEMDDASLLHIRLKKEAEERAMRNSPGRASHGHTRGHSLSSTNQQDGQSAYAPSSPDRGTTTATGGGANAGWYMTTGVLPAVLPPPGQSSHNDANLSRSGSLGQRSRLSKYGSLFDATGLDTSGGSARNSAVYNNNNNDTAKSGRPTSPKHETVYYDAAEYQGAGNQQGDKYAQSMTGLKSNILEYTIPATERNKENIKLAAPHKTRHDHSSHSPSISSPTQAQTGMNNQTTANAGRGAPGAGAGALPATVAAAGTTAQHRRNLSQERSLPAVPTSQAQGQGQGQGQNYQGQGQGTRGAPQVNTPPAISPEAEPGATISKFMEQMDIGDRRSKDAPVTSSREVGATGGAAVFNNNNNSNNNNGSGHDSRRGDNLPASVIAAKRENLTGFKEGQEQSKIIHPDLGEALPASEIARQRELQHAYDDNNGASRGSTQSQPRGPREQGLGQAASGQAAYPAVSSIPLPVSKAKANGSVPVPSSTQGRGVTKDVEVLRHQTAGPAHQYTQVSELKVIATNKTRYLEDPIPAISHPISSSHAHTHGTESGLFGNIAQNIPSYMFVNYTATVCEECVRSEQRLHALTHGGDKWRYTYSDPVEEGEMDSDDPNTRKTGRQDYQDIVTLANTNGRDESGNIKGPCQCEQCLENRKIVKQAAENGLIEKIFEGRRHPASELIETITYTTIIRAPIIEETITTIWCEEPNCSECALKQKEYEDQQNLEMIMGGMVVHETAGSDKYQNYKNRFGILRSGGSYLNSNSSDNNDASSGVSYTNTRAEGRTGIERLLHIAGNPRQESLRRKQNSDDWNGHVVGYEDQEIRGKPIEFGRQVHDLQDILRAERGENNSTTL